MSCGKTPTRRQVHGKKRAVVAKKHGTKIASKGTGVTKVPAKGGRSTGAGTLPKPKQKVTRSPGKIAQKTSAAPPRRSSQNSASNKSYQAWLKKHPFTQASTAAWAKAHPFKFNNTPFNRRQYLAWVKAHPFKNGGHTRKQALTHKVACHIKTRHAVSATRHATGHKRIVITRPATVRAAKPVKAARSARAVRAR